MERSEPRPLEDKDTVISPDNLTNDNGLEINTDIEPELLDAPIIAEVTPNLQVESLLIRGLRKAVAERRFSSLAFKQGQLIHRLNTRRTIAKSALELPLESTAAKNVAARMPSTGSERKHANKTDKRLGKALERGIAMQMLTQTIGIDGIPINSKRYGEALDTTNLTAKEKRGSRRGARAYRRVSRRVSRTRDLLTKEASGSDASAVVIADKLSRVSDKTVRAHSRLSAD